MRDLADQRIAADGIGYYAVLTERDGAQCLVFLSRCPVEDIGHQIQVRQPDGTLTVWGTGQYLDLVSQDGARAMLQENCVAVSDTDRVLHDTLYTLPAAESEEPTAVSPTHEPKLVLHSRFLELLAEKRQRDRRRWIANEILNETGLFYNTIKMFATDRVTGFGARTLDALCRFFDCTVDDLLVIGDEETTQ